MYDTRPRLETRKKLCPYCGKTRTYTYRDGYESVDYSSARSQYVQPKTDDKGCDCTLGKMEHGGEKFSFKRQCANCAWNEFGKCINAKERNDVSDLFGITGDLIIKDASKRCKHYKLSKEIFNAFIDFVD